LVNQKRWKRMNSIRHAAHSAMWREAIQQKAR